MTWLQVFVNKLYRIDKIAGQEDLEILESRGTYPSAKRDYATFAGFRLFGEFRDGHTDHVARILGDKIRYPARRRRKLCTTVL
jgi:hypothetical protein